MQYYNGVKIKYHTYTIEPDDGSFVVYGHSSYPASSVLAGQPMKSYLESFDSIEDAKKNFPKAEALEFKTEVNNTFDHLGSEEW